MKSQNGWEVVTDARGLRWWEVGETRLQLRPGAAGFLLCHVATWFNAKIEPLGTGGDDFGWALRKIGGSLEWSNHASGTAVDLNASKHPQGSRGTFSDRETELIRLRVEKIYSNKIKWGGNFTTIPDEMHWEIQGTFDEVKILVTKLRHTSIGEMVIEANGSKK